LGEGSRKHKNKLGFREMGAPVCLFKQGRDLEAPAT
jgi:hypothetical protein